MTFINKQYKSNNDNNNVVPGV